MGRNKINEDDIINIKKGKLTILKFHHRDERNLYYEAKCDCGNTIIVRRDNFLNGNTKSCGCKLKENKIDPTDIIGLTFGELHIDELYNNSCKEKYTYIATCSCGNKCIVGRIGLINGHRKSCGCLLEKIKRSNNGLSPSQIRKIQEM